MSHIRSCCALSFAYLIVYPPLTTIVMVLVVLHTFMLQEECVRSFFFLCAGKVGSLAEIVHLFKTLLWAVIKSVIVINMTVHVWCNILCWIYFRENCNPASRGFPEFV